MCHRIGRVRTFVLLLFVLIGALELVLWLHSYARVTYVFIQDGATNGAYGIPSRNSLHGVISSRGSILLLHQADYHFSGRHVVWDSRRNGCKSLYPDQGFRFPDLRTSSGPNPLPVRIFTTNWHYFGFAYQTSGFAKVATIRSGTSWTWLVMRRPGQIRTDSWGVVIPWWTLPLFSFGVSFWILRYYLVLRRRDHSGLCVNCGYDSRFTPQVCPECGRPPGSKRSSGKGVEGETSD